LEGFEEGGGGVVMKNQDADFMILCKALYLKGITPINILKCNDSDCITLRKVVQDCVDHYGLEKICGFFNEFQYRINLVAAHFVLERCENIEQHQVENALDVVKRYSVSPLNFELASEEMRWLTENKKIFD
jgi:hypothetical protein